ncbi:hypothetical protein [Nostoc sp. UHCC 0251]|uniref:hypothetical protein n=1 Tax=Nostoc sp. UHCC 0251 TaxID=3110240 RepID=UPI002B20391D|nr:hypothetical protein [Nostoc sp. UHCC 0251]MEA5624800.1 hypothetical protein [Nostoc sp. UHCC 0251]
MVVGSDAPTENPREEETAHAPLADASPQRTESASELEELPTTMDCTTLALVEATRSNPASLLAEDQDCSVEAIFPHEGICSAAPVAQNEKSLNSAIANQTQGQVEQSNSASLLAENSVSGVEVKADHEGTCSAAPVSSAEKWSHEAVVARSKARPLRMEKLKMAGILGEKPDFEFLAECWENDPALQIVIKNSP